MNLIDIRQVLTQIIGFLLMVWILRRYAWGPMLQMLEVRRQKIAAAFGEAERRQQEAEQLKLRYEQQIRDIEVQARQRIQQAAAEGEHLAAQIKAQAQRDAAERLERAQDEIAREHEKAKERLKQQIIRLSMRGAEKILREKLDESHQRRLVDEFIDEVEATR